MLLHLYLCWERVMCSIHNVVASVSLLGERKTEYMKVVCPIHAPRSSVSLLEKVRLNIWVGAFDPQCFCCLYWEPVHFQTFNLCILGACSLPDVQFVVSTKVACGYTHTISCLTNGDPWEPLARGINMRETTYVWTYLRRRLSCGSIF